MPKRALVAVLVILSAATCAVADPLRTRFVIGLERPVDFQVKALPNPNRVVVELPAIRISLPEQSEERLTGLVRSFRGGLSGPGRSRIVIDVTAPVVVERAAIETEGEGHRLVLEIAPLKLGETSPPPDFKLSKPVIGKPQPKHAIREEWSAEEVCRFTDFVHNKNREDFRAAQGPVAEILSNVYRRNMELWEAEGGLDGCLERARESEHNKHP